MRSSSKKIIGGVIGGILATTLIIALIPVFMYGFAVNTVTINYNPFFSMFPSPSTSDDSISINSFGFGSYAFTGGTLEAEHTVISPYAYFDVKTKGNCAGTGSLDFSSIPGFEAIDIILLFQLTITNPLAQSVTLDFSLQDIAGDLSIDIILGPDMIQIVNGTYQMSLFALLSLTYSGTTLFSGNLTIDGTVDVIIY
ncbi:MAG: hypothetical protein ACFFBP_16250 [Promethearchaeota archaeon]